MSILTPIIIVAIIVMVVILYLWWIYKANKMVSSNGW